MKLISLFTGAGGLDLGFERAGFEISYANEFDKSITDTFKYNFKHTELDTRSITDVDEMDLPDCVGIIGGPPCQSWSEAGALRGIKDKRGQLFFDFIRILDAKRPLFFLAENVSGMLAARNAKAITGIIKLFEKSGYTVKYYLLDTSDYGVPQTRKRVIFVGYRKDLNLSFIPPQPTTIFQEQKRTLKDTIYDLRNSAVKSIEKNYTNINAIVDNHEYMHGSFSSIYMSRNRVRGWDEQSFTIQAGGRHAPIHPDAPKMLKVEKNKMKFVEGSEKLYRRLSVRECARIQTFPDDYKFIYKRISDGYKMIGNAVPVDFAEILAKKIITDLKSVLKGKIENYL